MLDRITHLFRLRAIVEEGSLRRAAERLNVSQSSLSRSLSQLETRYGQPLLIRHARGVEPTAFGKRVLSMALRLERQWELLDRQMAIADDEGRMHLRIGAGPVWRNLILPDILLQAQAAFPRLSFDTTLLQYSTAIEDLREGRLDVLFMGALDKSNLRHLWVQPMLTVTDRLMARENHPLFSEIDPDRQETWEKIQDYPWLVYESATIFEGEAQHALLGALGFKPKVSLSCDAFAMAVSIMQKSDYIGILPDVVAIGALSPRVVPLPINIHTNSGNSGMICREEMADWPQISALYLACKKWVNESAHTFNVKAAIS